MAMYPDGGIAREQGERFLGRSLERNMKWALCTPRVMLDNGLTET